MEVQGLILSGGRGTRLGPLGVQRSKCLVTVGSKPMLVRQYQLLRGAGADKITVIVAPHAAPQVTSVGAAAALSELQVVVQRNPVGPIDALLTGLLRVEDEDDDVIVLFADTLLDAEDLPEVTPTVVIGAAPTARNFCLYQNGTFRDVNVGIGAAVCVGAYRFSVTKVVRAAQLHRYDDHMSDFLNELNPEITYFAPSWQDVGDVESLAVANHSHFISRDFNRLELDERGVVTKHGTNLTAELHAMYHVPQTAKHMYPQVFNSRQGGGDDYYEMEFISLPTLAELYLYWPRDPQMWKHITQTLTQQLNARHWPTDACDVGERAHTTYVDALTSRYDVPLELLPLPHRFDAVTVNGQSLVVGSRLLGAATRVGAQLATRAKPGVIHGDPNFTNVLWSLETATFKLLDPRGTWGGPGLLGDICYDVGKIAYSPIFARVAHGLFDLSREAKHHFKLHAELHTDHIIDAVLLPYLAMNEEHLRQLVGWLLLSGAPLHRGDEATALYLIGAQYLQEWVQ